MGADLLIAICPAPRFHDGAEIRPEDWDANLSRQVASRVNLNAWLNWFPDGDIEADELLAVALGAARTVIAEFDEPGRASFFRTCRTCGDRELIHGGTSYGDDPSDEFQGILACAETDIFATPYNRTRSHHRTGE